MAFEALIVEQGEILLIFSYYMLLKKFSILAPWRKASFSCQV